MRCCPSRRNLRSQPEWDASLVTRDYTVRRLCSTKPKLGAMLAYVEAVKRNAKAKPNDIWLSDCVVRLILTCTDKLRRSDDTKSEPRAATLLKNKRDDSCISIAHEWFELRQAGDKSSTAPAVGAARPSTALQQHSRRPQSAIISGKPKSHNAWSELAPTPAQEKRSDGDAAMLLLPPRPQSAAVKRLSDKADLLLGFRRPNLYRSQAARMRRSLVPGSLEDVSALEALANEVDAIAQRQKSSARPETGDDEDQESENAMTWLDDMWNEKRERELTASRRKEEVRKALQKWEQQRVMLEQRARERRRNRVRGARLALENRMKEEHAAAAAASGRPETAPHSFRQSGHADDKRDAADTPGGMPADDIPQDGLLLETEGSAYAESGSKASHVLDSDDEAEKLARMSINAESSMGPCSQWSSRQCILGDCTAAVHVKTIRRVSGEILQQGYWKYS